MGWWRGLFGTFGVLASVLGAGLLLAPSVFSRWPVAYLITAIEGAGTEQVLLVTGSGLIGFLALALRTPDPETNSDQPSTRFEQAVTDTSDEGIAAGEIDETIENAIESGGESLIVLREQLRTTAVAVYMDITGCSAEVARTAINRGEWCRDPVAGIFLADSNGPSPSLLAKARLFLFPEQERRRRIARTIIAIEELETAS